MTPKPPMSETVLIVLDSLAAEGTPRLALELSRIWLGRCVRPVIVILHTTPADLRADFDALNIECVPLDIARRGYWRYARLMYGVFSIARQKNAVAVLSMPLGWHSLMGIAARFAGVRRVVAHIGNYPNPGTGRAFKKFRALVCLGRPFTDQLICCSNYVQDGAIRHFGLSARETCVVYNGVSLSAFARRAAAAAARQQSRDAGAPYTIGMVARLEAHKDHSTLIDAARLLKMRGRRLRVCLVGEGSLRAKLAQRIVDSDTSDTIMLLGTRRDIPELIGSFDLFVFSTTPDEGMGIALVEAMAAGVPIIASDVGACREVLDCGRLGVLVQPADAAALADAIETNMDTPMTAVSRARDAQTHAMRTFSIEKMASSYAGLLGLSVPDVTPAHDLERAELAR